ncbi:MAG: hypothetical protein AB8H79_14970 [Myxococcota bacterium]
MRRLFALALLCTLPARATVVDRVVMVVDDEIILASDVHIESILSGLDAPPLPFWTLEHGTGEERLREAAIVRALAAGVQLYEPKPDEVDARLALVKLRLGSSWEPLKALTGLDDAAARRLFVRRMVVERYLSRNVPDDPDNPKAWLAACHDFLEQVQGRYTVRVVAPRGGP